MNNKKKLILSTINKFHFENKVAPGFTVQVHQRFRCCHCLNLQQGTITTPDGLGPPPSVVLAYLAAWQPRVWTSLQCELTASTISWMDRALTWGTHTHTHARAQTHVKAEPLGTVPWFPLVLWIDHVVGGVVRGTRVLVRQRRQREVPPLQKVLVLVGFAQLHAFGDSFVAEFLQRNHGK